MKSRSACVTGSSRMPLERGFGVDRLTDARSARLTGAGSNSYEIAGSNSYEDVAGSGDKQAQAKLCHVEIDDVAVAFGPPA